MLCALSRRWIFGQGLVERVGGARSTYSPSVLGCCVVGLGLLLLSILGQGSAGNAYALRDPETGVVRLLHIGKIWQGYDYPGPVFDAEPRISWFPVPAFPKPDCVCERMRSYGEREVRELRTKLPRSKEDLLDHYDVMVIDGMYAFDLPTSLANWVVQAVERDGFGFMMVDDAVTFAGAGQAPSWYLTPIGDILPVDDYPSTFGWRERFEIVPTDPNPDPLVGGFDFSGVWLVANNRPTPRRGSTVIAEMSPTCLWNVGKPVMVYWELGKGRSFAYVHRWHSGLGNFYEWKYHADFLCSLIYFTAQIPIPQDLELVHRTRSMLAEVDTDWQVLLSAMEAAYKFGANLQPINRELEQIYNERREANRRYIYEDFEGCMSSLGRVRSQVEELIKKTITLKDAVMFWVFAIQWLAVSGTSVMVGFLLWTIMVRRKLYAQVGITRPIRQGD